MDNQIQNRIATSSNLTEAVFKIFTPDDIRVASPMPMRNFIYMVRRRLEKAQPPPTVDELDGLRELAFEHLWAGALDPYSGIPRQPANHEHSDLHIHRNCDIVDGPASACPDCLADADARKEAMDASAHGLVVNRTSRPPL